MEVADIVRVVNDLGALGGVALHGVVRGIIRQPDEFFPLEISSGNWAVLDVYAITCLKENPFTFSESTLLTPKGSVVFVLEDTSLVGKVVSVYGSSLSGGVTLKRQDNSGKVSGYGALVFKKVRGSWVVLPNVVKPFERTSSREVDQYFAQCKEVGFEYLDFTSQYMSFYGSKDYSLLNPSIKEAIHSTNYTTNFGFNSKIGNLGFIRQLLEKAENKRRSKSYLSVGSEVSIFDRLKYKLIEAHEEGTLLARIVPNTTVRFSSFVNSLSIDSYSGFLSVLLGAELGSIDLPDLEQLLMQRPHALYLEGYLSFDEAESIYYISSCLSGKYLDSYWRNIAFLVEGCYRSFERNGTTLFLNTLASKPICKVSEKLQTSFKDTKTPLGKVPFSLLQYFLGSCLDYSNLISDGFYYKADDFDLVLGDAALSGFIIKSDNQYMPYRLAEMEYNVLAILSYLSDSRVKYNTQRLNDHLRKYNKGKELVLTLSQEKSLNLLSSRFGVFMGSADSYKDIIKVITGLFSNRGTYKSIHIIGTGKPISEDYLGLDRLYFSILPDAPMFPEDSLILVERAHRLSLSDLEVLLTKVRKGSSVYLFGNPWIGDNYFKTICGAFPRALVMEEDASLNLEDFVVVNNGSCLDFTEGKKVAYKQTSRVEVLPVLKKMVDYAIERGYSLEDITIISDLSKQLSAENVSSYLGKNLKTEDVLSHPLCMTSLEAEKSRGGITFFLCQECSGVLYRESVIRALENASGISFIGSPNSVLEAKYKRTSLRSTLLRGLSS